MNLLELDNVELSYGKNQVLKSIYFKAEKGRVTGILGSNGCGKTSLLKILFGILKPNNKLIRIDHKPVLKPLYTLGKIHYLPQFHYIPASMTLKTVFDHHGVSMGRFIELFPIFMVVKKLSSIDYQEEKNDSLRCIHPFILKLTSFYLMSLSPT